MKRALLLFVLAGCASPPSAGPAPAFELAGLDGKFVRSSEVWAERPVLVVFMTSW